MTPYLTAPNVELDRLVRQTPPGMMYWSGTSADPKAACGGCRHYGYDSVVRDDAGNALTTHKHPSSCALFHKHTEHHGKALPPVTLACKYFEAKQS